MTLHHTSFMLSASQSRGARLSPLSCESLSPQDQLRAMHSNVVNSLMTCVVSDKQLTSVLAGISMTLVLQHLAVFGVVVGVWTLDQETGTYVIFDIHNLARCDFCTSTSTVDFCLLGWHQPPVLRLFPRYSVEIYTSVPMH